MYYFVIKRLKLGGSGYGASLSILQDYSILTGPYINGIIRQDLLLHFSHTYVNITSAGRIPELAKGIRL